MNKLYAQFLREFWEHRGLLITAPLVMVVIMALFTAVTFYGLQHDSVLILEATKDSDEQIQPDDSQKTSWRINFSSDNDTGKLEGDMDFSPTEIFTEKNKLSSIQSGIYAVASMITILLSLIYATGSLHADRRDRSIMFFKSLPVSETQVVLTRLAVAVVIMPFLASLCAMTGSLIYLMAASLYGVLYMDVSLLNAWQQGSPFTIFIKSVIAGLLAGLWSLPLFSWLLLCSAWAKKSPMFNIMMPVIVLVILDRILFEKSIVTKGLKNYFSGFKNGDFFGNIPTAIDAKWNLGEFFLRPELWIGVTVAIVFIGMAIILRNRRFEI